MHIRKRQLGHRHLFVVDGLFHQDFVRILYESFIRLPFTLNDYDTEATKDVRHWKHEFEPDVVARHPVFSRWHDVIVDKTRELFVDMQISISRIHCNNHPYGDLQHPHQDHAGGVTAVYFANIDWSDDLQGEMLFYDEGGEPFYAVAPRPGRVVFFPGDVVHRGGVPSRVGFEPRLSVAFKFTGGSGR